MHQRQHARALERTGFGDGLVTWVQNAKTQGVPIYAVSAGNEPDSCGINSTTSYSAAQMAAWIDVLGPAMAAIGVKVMAPETMNGYGFPATLRPSKRHGRLERREHLREPRIWFGRYPPTSIAAAGKEYWETEVDTGTANGDSSGDGIASALKMAKDNSQRPDQGQPQRVAPLVAVQAAVTAAAASTTRARKCGPSASGSWATSRGLCGLVTCAFPPLEPYRRGSCSLPTGTRRMGPWPWWPSTTTPLPLRSHCTFPESSPAASRRG